MSQPTPEEQVQFLLRVQRLLNEGQFTATYKFALLLAISDLAVEHGDDTGGALRLSVNAIAAKYIGYYWRQSIPYVPRGGGSGVVLQQNTDRQAAIVRLIAQARSSCASLAEFERDRHAWDRLVSRVAGYFWNQPLWRLQRIGEEVLDFLYESREIGTRVDAIELRRGAAFCLRRFHPLVTEMVRGAWLAYMRRVNASVLGATADLEEFLFGSERNALGAIRPALVDLQAGRCFYCQRDLGRGTDGAVDHFVPWARYPVDLGHNFVLAHASCKARRARCSPARSTSADGRSGIARSERTSRMPANVAA